MRGMIDRNMILILCAALAAGLGFWVAQRYFGPVAPAQPIENPLAIRMRTVRLFATPRVLPAFHLTAENGSTITGDTLKGRWSLVFLGFTHCPDVCPTTLQDLAVAQTAWADLPADKMPRILFVSVDPERDTPMKTGEYAHYFSPRIDAATADLPTLEAFAKSLGMVFMKVPAANGDYSIDHSASVSLIDPQGRMAGLIRPPLDSKKIGADLRILAGSD